MYGHSKGRCVGSRSRWLSLHVSASTGATSPSSRCTSAWAVCPSGRRARGERFETRPPMASCSASTAVSRMSSRSFRQPHKTDGAPTGSLEAELRLRGGRDLTSISGDVLAQLTSPEEKAPERAGARARRERNLSGEMRADSGPRAPPRSIRTPSTARSSRQRESSRQGSCRLRSRRQPCCDWRRAGYRSKHSIGSCLRARSPPPGRSASVPGTTATCV